MVLLSPYGKMPVQYFKLGIGQFWYNLSDPSFANHSMSTMWHYTAWATTGAIQYDCNTCEGTRVIDGVVGWFCRLPLSDCDSCTWLNESPFASVLVFILGTVPSDSQSALKKNLTQYAHDQYVWSHCMDSLVYDWPQLRLHKVWEWALIWQLMLTNTYLQRTLIGITALGKLLGYLQHVLLSSWRFM
jgi:hypothetical protein